MPVASLISDMHRWNYAFENYIYVTLLANKITNYNNESMMMQTYVHVK